MAKTFFSEIYGCQMNISDTQELEAILESRGLSRASLAKEADVVLINTCAVRQTAQDRVLAHLGFYKNLKAKKDFILIFMGCVAAKEKENILKQYPFVDYVVSPSARHLIPDLIENHSGIRNKEYYRDFPSRVFGSSNEELSESSPLPPVVDREYPFRAFITIIHGCSKFCTYCIVPYTRGREVSVPSSIILDRARDFAARGVKEIYLLGQNVNSYGIDSGDWSFAKLLQEISKISGIERIKFISSHPRDISLELIEELAKNPKISRNLHLALQSGSDLILQKMNRQHTLAEFKEKISKLRELAPDFQISTDIIVGFPFEREKEYEETKAALIDLQFSNAFIYMYSEREGTAASRMQDIIPLEVKKRRAQELMKIQREITQNLLKSMLEKSHTLLVEEKGNRADQWKGFTTNGMSAVFEVSPEDTKDYGGQIIRVLAREIRGATLYTERL